MPWILGWRVEQSCELITAWCELNQMRGRLPDRPGKPRCVVKVSWEHLAEASVCKVFNTHYWKNFLCIPGGGWGHEIWMGHAQSLHCRSGCSESDRLLEEAVKLKSPISLCLITTELTWNHSLAWKVCLTRDRHVRIGFCKFFSHISKNMISSHNTIKTNTLKVMNNEEEDVESKGEMMEV